MKSWKRITLVVFVLIGGTATFGYWAINQFDSVFNVFDDLSAQYFANTYSVYLSFKQDTESASTSPEIYGGLATSTDSGLASTSDPGVASTSLKTLAALATSTDPNLAFTFPQKDADVYIGCTYPISWQSSMVISSLEAALIDAGTRETVGPKTSGLAKENTIGVDLQNLEWSVGIVWPGAYYIKISKINSVEAVFRSKVFEIKNMPEGIDKEEKINICRESSGKVSSL